MYYAYKYRLTPSDAHRERLDRHRDICRQLYNHALYRFNQIPEDAGTRCIDVVSESISLDHPNAPEGGIHGRDAFEDDVRGPHEGFPDHHLTIDAMLTDGEIVMTEWTTTGTHEGEYKGVPPTGHELDLTGMATTRIEDGQIQQDRLYYDRQEMSRSRRQYPSQSLTSCTEGGHAPPADGILTMTNLVD